MFTYLITWRGETGSAHHSIYVIAQDPIHAEIVARRTCPWIGEVLRALRVD